MDPTDIPAPGKEFSLKTARLLQARLGQPDEEWKGTADGSPYGFTLLKYSGRPSEGVAAYLTLGLSDRELDLPGEGPVRQELLICHEEAEGWNSPSLLHYTAERLLQQGQALRQGEVLDYSETLFDGYSFEGLYCALPLFFDLTDEALPVRFLQLIPLNRGEITYIEEMGWREFEKRVEKMKGLLLDLLRGDISDD